jgi:hypothetical protein
MTDRELLEKAAKASGIEGEHRTEHLCVDGDWMDVTAIFLADGMGWWNPLEDDGDALRLAAELGIDVTYKAFGEDEVMVSASEDQFGGWFTEPYGDDKAAATRRAIVRAAAEIADAPGDA